MWAGKLSKNIEAAAHKVKGLDPAEWQKVHAEPLMPTGANSWDRHVLPLGFRFEVENGLGEPKKIIMVHISVWFEEGGSKRYRIETTVYGKKLPVTERTTRRLKIKDFFAPLQKYVDSHKDELITTETLVWYDVDPSDNLHIALTEGGTDWRDGYADGVSIEEPPWALTEWKDKLDEMEKRHYDELDTLGEDEDYDAVERRQREERNRLEEDFRKALWDFFTDEWRPSKKRLGDLASPGELEQAIEDLKDHGSAGL